VAQSTPAPKTQRLPAAVDFEARRVSFVILLVYAGVALLLLAVWCVCRFEAGSLPNPGL